MRSGEFHCMLVFASGRVFDSVFFNEKLPAKAGIKPNFETDIDV